MWWTALDDEIGPLGQCVDFGSVVALLLQVTELALLEVEINCLLVHLGFVFQCPLVLLLEGQLSCLRVRPESLRQVTLAQMAGLPGEKLERQPGCATCSQEEGRKTPGRTLCGVHG